jgi:2-dehydro-3-deoxyphosphogluconate aldolase/(4S)-4-hydroxy-2-oxoglutarate aldolase
MSQGIFDIIKQEKIISIIRGIDTEHILPTIQALYEGGIKCVEITLDHTSAQSVFNSAASIKMAGEQFSANMQIGAGTVLTPQEVLLVKEAGAQYIISPNADETVIKETKKLGLVSLPGAMTPSEIVAAHNWGADIVKVFPAGDLGPGYIKSLRGPLGHIPLMAVGGVNLDNLGDFLKAGAMGAGIGGNLANKKLISEGNFAAITDLAKHFVALV